MNKQNKQEEKMCKKCVNAFRLYAHQLTIKYYIIGKIIKYGPINAIYNIEYW